MPTKIIPIQARTKIGSRYHQEAREVEFPMFEKDLASLREMFTPEDIFQAVLNQYIAKEQRMLRDMLFNTYKPKKRMSRAMKRVAKLLK